MKTEEIKKNLYKINFSGTEFPIYIKIERELIRITQPNLNEGEKFKEEDYFWRGVPQEMVLGRKQIKEVLNFLGKLQIVEELG